jgi:hypothetical protein
MATSKNVGKSVRKTSGTNGPTKIPPLPPGKAPAVRFEARLAAGVPRAKAVAAAAALDLDRLPDAEGQVRLLISADDARRLLGQGFEVHLTAAVPVAPLNKALVMSDAQAGSWLDERIKGLPRQGGL